MKFYQGIFIAMLMFIGFSVHAAAPGEGEGIELQSTRVIYSGNEKKGITFTVTNRTSQLYLLQSRVIPWAVSDSAEEPKVASVDESMASVVPFIVVPPLIRFAPEDEMTLRIRLTENSLPKDRESVFILALKAIPSQSAPGRSSENEGMKIVLALQNNLKLFYRPEGLLAMDAIERSKQLQFSRQGKQLTINNPTPYYVTLGDVRLDTQPVPLDNRKMIAPFSAETYEVSLEGAKSVNWQIIDDEGRKTPSQTQPLS